VVVEQLYRQVLSKRTAELGMVWRLTLDRFADQRLHDDAESITPVQHDQPAILSFGGHPGGIGAALRGRVVPLEKSHWEVEWKQGLSVEELLQLVYEIGEHGLVPQVEMDEGNWS
jgi:hypothetical protein